MLKYSNLKMAMAALLLASIGAVIAGAETLRMNTRAGTDYGNVQVDVSFTQAEKQ